MSNRLRIILVYWAAWVGLSLYFTVGDLLIDRTSSMGFLLRLNLGQLFPWALAAALLIWLADRYPVDSWKAWRRILLHVFVNVAAAAVAVVFAFGVMYLMVPSTRHWVANRGWNVVMTVYIARWYHVNVLVLATVTWTYHWYRTRQELRKRELEAAQLESRFAMAQNQALRWQLQPHFLFNTLNSIAALVHGDPDGADRMISRLGDFLRQTLESEPRQEVTLRQELGLIQSYLAIEQVRFGERLKVVVKVPPELMARPVPSLILQPLVENALKHGIGDQAGGGTLTLRARCEAGALLLEVQDDGPGFTRIEREGIGLRNIRARLGLLYGAQGSLMVNSIPGKGTLVTLRLPGCKDPA